LEDGDVLKVGGLMFMDSADHIAQQVAAAFVSDKPRIRGYDNRTLRLHQPGARFIDERHYDGLVVKGSMRDKASVYAQYDFEKSQEWSRTPEQRLEEAKASAAHAGPMKGNSNPASEEYQEWRRKQSAEPFVERTDATGAADQFVITTVCIPRHSLGITDESVVKCTSRPGSLTSRQGIIAALSIVGHIQSITIGEIGASAASSERVLRRPAALNKNRTVSLAEREPEVQLNVM
jgi:hypothetical protein